MNIDNVSNQTNDLLKKHQTRREILGWLGRGPGALLLLAGGWELHRRSSKENRTRHTCINTGDCLSCRIKQSCVLPTAESARLFQANKSSAAHSAGSNRWKDE